MTPPTPFEQAVISIIKQYPHSSISSTPLRHALMDRGFGKHPAAVACNLTRIAWKERYFTCFSCHHDRNFILTSDGRAWENP
jgi:hypothetical protein